MPIVVKKLTTRTQRFHKVHNDKLNLDVFYTKVLLRQHPLYMHLLIFAFIPEPIKICNAFRNAAVSFGEHTDIHAGKSAYKF